MPPRKRGKASASVDKQYVDKIEEKVVKLPGQLRDWQVKCVCGGTHLTCNGGWMKSIEDQAKPIMKDLIVGNERRISPDEQKIIATWAILKVIIAEYDVKGDITIHYKQRQYISPCGRI
jgi:hypothetical protein